MVPPKVPVYSYHCIHLGFAANTFPRFSQGQVICQFKCKNSHEHQNAMKANGIVILGKLHFLIQCHAPNTQLMKKAFKIMAAMAPGIVLFHIHQVTPTFHIRNARKENQRARQNPNLATLSSSISLTFSSGTNAMNIKKVKPQGYHESHSSTPENRLRMVLFFRSDMIELLTSKERKKRIYLQPL